MGSASRRNSLILLTAFVFLSLIAIFLFRGEDGDTHATILPAEKSRPIASDPAPGAGSPGDPAPRRDAPDLPPQGTPWAVSKHTLFARALRGDKMAADRLFRDTQTCVRVLLDRNELQSFESSPEAGLTVEGIQEKHRIESLLRARLANDGTICTEDDADDVAKNADQILLAAVHAGNRKAAACYLDASFHDGIGKPQDAELERYFLHTSDLIESELKQGNWYVVTVMTFAYSSGRKFGLYAQLVPTDPAKEYAYLKLQQLGAVGSLKEAKDERVNSILASGRLSEDEVRRSDEWAESMFTKYFHEPLTSDQPPDCFNADSGR